MLTPRSMKSRDHERIEDVLTKIFYEEIYKRAGKLKPEEEVKKAKKKKKNINTATPKNQNITSTEITDAVFNLKPIYPNDLNAKSFTKKYANGDVRFQVELKDGLKHGRYEAFYPNGIRKIRGRFRDDEQVGTWRYYNEDGEQVHKKRF